MQYPLTLMNTSIDSLFLERCRTPHNIDQHLSVLRQYAKECESVVEFGTELGFSTTAFLAARPKRLDCWDVVRTDWVGILEQLADRNTAFTFHLGSSLDAQFERCDLLFVDTLHTDAQVTAELTLHGHKVQKYIILHDVVSCPVIVPAIWAYFGQRSEEWEVEEWLTNQSGLAIFRRIGGFDNATVRTGSQ